MNAGKLESWVDQTENIRRQLKHGQQDQRLFGSSVVQSLLLFAALLLSTCLNFSKQFSFCLFVLVGDVEEMESDDEDDAAPMVTIGDRRLAYHDVTDEMVAMMTPAEKEEYIRIGQEMYENYYE